MSTMNLPEEYLKERFDMIVRLELGAQRGPKSVAAIQAEVKQLRSILEDKMKVKYVMTGEELKDFIVKHFDTTYEVDHIDFIMCKDVNEDPYLTCVEINCNI